MAMATRRPETQGHIVAAPGSGSGFKLLDLVCSVAADSGATPTKFRYPWVHFPCGIFGCDHLGGHGSFGRLLERSERVNSECLSELLFRDDILTP